VQGSVVELLQWNEMSWLVSSQSEDYCGSVLVSCCCEKLVAEDRGQFRNPEEGERPPLEAATEQRLAKTQQTENTYLSAVVNCRPITVALRSKS
jgi:hypothetical protein